MKFTLRKKEELLVMKKTIHAFETKKAKLSEIITSMQTPHPRQIWGIGQQAKTKQGAYKIIMYLVFWGQSKLAKPPSNEDNARHTCDVESEKKGH